MTGISILCDESPLRCTRYWSGYRHDLAASTTPMASPEGNYAVFCLVSEYRAVFMLFCTFFVIILLLKSCTLVHNFTHYAPLLCTKFLCTMQISEPSVLLLYLFLRRLSIDVKLITGTFGKFLRQAQVKR